MYEIDKAQFGRFVAELRRENNYTQKQLAELLNISDKAISKWERGLSLAVAAYLLITGGIGNLLPGGLTIVFLSIFFGIYFCFFAKDRLPDYYDENRISCYSDGIFRLNLAGVRFSNRNWPYILKALRFWCCWAPIAMTLVMLAVRSFFPGLNNSIYLPAIFVVFLGGLFVPVYITAKRHE